MTSTNQTDRAPSHGPDGHLGVIGDMVDTRLQVSTHYRGPAGWTGLAARPLGATRLIGTLTNGGQTFRTRSRDPVVLDIVIGSMFVTGSDWSTYPLGRFGRTGLTARPLGATRLIGTLTNGGQTFRT